MHDFVEYLEQPSLTKAELAAQVHETLGITRREAREMVDSFFGLIAESLRRGEDVKIANFGNFELRQKAARPGRNPRTGETVVISSRRTVKFFASSKQIDLLQGKALPQAQASTISPRRAGQPPAAAMPGPHMPAA